MESEERFHALFNKYESRLRAFVHARCRNRRRVDPDDVLQELRLKLWQALQRETTLTNPASYVMQVAASVLIDAQRRAGVREPEGGFTDLDPEQGGGDPDPAAEAESREAADRLEAALDRLASDRGRAARLYLQGYGSAEIARLTGWTEPRARNLLYRGLADLRGLMEDDHE